MARIRLFVDHPLGPGQSVPLTADQAHYLFSVMRLSVGATVLLFNGDAGEWRAEIAEARRRAGRLVCCVETRPLQPPPRSMVALCADQKSTHRFHRGKGN